MAHQSASCHLARRGRSGCCSVLKSIRDYFIQIYYFGVERDVELDFLAISVDQFQRAFFQESQLFEFSVQI